MAIKIEFLTEYSKAIDGIKKIQDSVHSTSKAMTDAFDAQVAAVERLGERMSILAEEIEKAEAAGDAKAVEEKTHAYEELGKELEKEKKAFEEMYAAFGKMGGGGSGSQSADNMQMRMRQLKREAEQLTLQYRMMSDEEKESARGQELLKKIKQLVLLV